MTTRISDRFFDFLLSRFTRRRWVANRADPTEVVRYGWHPRRRFAPTPAGGWRLSLDIVASWGVEATVTVLGRKWRTYDAALFRWLYGGLEGAHERRELALDDDPMGRLSDYE
jgi:hypothetical protein